jgi:hypothetical protein
MKGRRGDGGRRLTGAIESAPARYKEVPMINVRSAILLAGLVLMPAVLPAEAMPMPAVAMTKTPSTAFVQVRDHGHRHGHHRRDHLFSGRADYDDRDDQSGVLFKSFITGTLFR